jgi:hypothetical protein
MTIQALTEFLIARKMKLAEGERLAKGKAKMALLMQLQVVETILIFLNQKERDDLMEKLELSLDKQAILLSTLKPVRKSTDDTIEAVKELLKTIPPGHGKPLNGPNIKPKSMAAKLYRLKKAGLLPPEMMITTHGTTIYIGRK